ncbi:hypothetical protein BH10PSE17_BH10PSE17_10680 [soil metagenome]
MKRRAFVCSTAILTGGCGMANPYAGLGGGVGGLFGSRASDAAAGGSGRTGMAADFDGMMSKNKLIQDMMASPDLPAWHDQREKMALAIGDRNFDASFDRLFDSTTTALASLGSRVTNMERVSGYISASAPDLGPARTRVLQDEGMRQYAMAKGYPASVLDKSNSAFDMDVTGTSNMMSRGMSGLTLSLVRQGAKRTKAKLRFDNIYYPDLVNELYKTVWAAVDKQMFLDKGLD